jgi:hypothetical protein
VRLRVGFAAVELAVEIRRFRQTPRIVGPAHIFVVIGIGAADEIDIVELLNSSDALDFGKDVIPACPRPVMLRLPAWRIGFTHTGDGRS